MVCFLPQTVAEIIKKEYARLFRQKMIETITEGTKSLLFLVIKGK